MRYNTKRATDHLNYQLNLGATGDEQDWELELSDGERVEEFIEYFHQSERDDELDFALCSLIVASFDEAVDFRIDDGDTEFYEFFVKNGNDIEKIYTIETRDLWLKVKGVLDTNRPLFSQIIRYWACDEEEDGAWRSTLFFRCLLDCGNDAGVNTVSDRH